jgi:tRNA(fMet)-specific endonuclease VapC
VILLDTNHLTVLKYPEDARHEGLLAKLETSTDQHFAIPVIVVEEQLRGWLAVIHGATKADKLIGAYSRLASLIRFLSSWEIADFDEEAAAHADRLRSNGVRIGTMDLRIAAIALARDATLVTANLNDFSRVPELKVENWFER